MANVRTSIATLIAAAALSGGVYTGTVSSPPPDKVGVSEIVQLRTINSKTFDKGEGERVFFSTPKPIHWNDKGTLKTIDVTVRRRPLLTALLSKYEFESYIGEAKALFDSSNVADYAFSWKGVSIDYQFLTSQSKMTIKTEVNTTGVKQTYVLNSGAATTLKWLVTGADKKLNADGSLVVLDENAQPMFYVPAPMASSSNGLVPINVVLDADTLIYLVDDSSAIYPITVDPTTVMYTVTAAATSGMYFDTNASYLAARNSTVYNATIAYYVGQSWGGSTWAVMRTHLYFDTSTLPDDATVTAGRLCIGAVADDPDPQAFNLHTIEATTVGDTKGTDWYNDFVGWAVSGAYSITDLANVVTSTSYPSVGDSVIVNLNATGLTKVSLTAATRLFILSSRDISSTTCITNEYIGMGGGNHYLQVTYTVPAGFAGKIDTLSGVTKVDGINGVLKIDGIQ